MLPRVLLHVIEPAAPIDRTADGVADRAVRQRLGEDVRDAVVLGDDVGDRRSVERAQIEWLAA